MMLVQTKVGPSTIHGIGVFADQFIPKGTPTWKFMPGFDLKVDKSQLDRLSGPSKEQFLRYAYLNPHDNTYVLCFDDARFFNHSDNPNCISTRENEVHEGVDIAARNIEKGEELTCDYRIFDGDTEYKMSSK